MARPRNYEHVLGASLDHLWAVTQAQASVIASIIVRHIAGDPPDEDAIAAALVARANHDARRQASLTARNGVEVISFFGTVASRMNLLSESSGGTDYETLTAQFRGAVADPHITRIIVDCDSPGGTAAGAIEFARVVREARAVKPITAVANHMMASAALWTLSGASEIVATPSAMVGSVGVVTLHRDLSAMMEKEGIKHTLISAGRYKTEGNSYEPLSETAYAHIKARVDSVNGRFIKDLAEGRRVSVSTVRTKFGEGRLLDAEEALSVGMVDRIATWEEVLATVEGSRHGTVSTISASLEPHRATLARASLAAHRHQLEAAARVRALH